MLKTTCAYDGTKRTDDNGRCKKCGQTREEAKRNAWGYDHQHSIINCPDLINHHNHAHGSYGI